MFADKSKKSDKIVQKVSTVSKSQKRKPPSPKPVQRAVAATNALLRRGMLEPIQMKQRNSTGMPDQLKAGVESLSGMDLSDVRVHYNSDKPAQVGALAYTQGSDIHVASGQERHLAHEAWHVVQQAQGRVQPTMQLQGVKVNDNPGLEHEADIMGARAQNYTGNGAQKIKKK